MSATQRKGLLMVPADIVDFWREAGPKRWYAKEPAFDEEIRQRFKRNLGLQIGLLMLFAIVAVSVAGTSILDP